MFCGSIPECLPRQVPHLPQCSCGLYCSDFLVRQCFTRDYLKVSRNVRFPLPWKYAEKKKRWTFAYFKPLSSWTGEQFLKIFAQVINTFTWFEFAQQRFVLQKWNGVGNYIFYVIFYVLSDSNILRSQWFRLMHCFQRGILFFLKKWRENSSEFLCHLNRRCCALQSLFNIFNITVWW